MSNFSFVPYPKPLVLLNLFVFMTGFISGSVAADCSSQFIFTRYSSSSCNETEVRNITISSWEQEVENSCGSEYSVWSMATSTSLNCDFSSSSVAGITWCRIDCIAEGIPKNNCSPSPSKDWIITKSCTLTGSKIASKNVIVKNGAVLAIANSAALDIDFLNYHLKVEKGSGVLIKHGGKIH